MSLGLSKLAPFFHAYATHLLIGALVLIVVFVALWITLNKIDSILQGYFPDNRSYGPNSKSVQGRKKNKIDYL